jgi:hypothetical protein
VDLEAGVVPFQPAARAVPAAAVGLPMGEPCRVLCGPELSRDDAEGAGVEAPPGPEPLGST